jgi:hypothetical protein
MLSVTYKPFMLSIIALNVFMLSVVAPLLANAANCYQVLISVTWSNICIYIQKPAAFG